MSPSPRTATAPPIAELAELLHQGSSGHAGSVLVTVEPGRTDLALGMWPVPPEVDHPADPLIGFLAPSSWSTLGLVTSGTLWPDPDPDPDLRAHGPTSWVDPRGEAVRLTVLLGRDGTATSLMSRGNGDPEVLEGPPQGWVPDVLARALGRPTPPPDTTLSFWVERAWLDHLAARLMGRPGSIRRWDDVSRAHPLSPPGDALPGVLLALEAQALDHESSWERMRTLWNGPLSTTIVPPGGRSITVSRWFDDGSFSRWVQRNLPEPADLLPVVLDSLPAALADELCEALVGIDPTEP